jgi:hypothetical protein
MSAMKRKIFEEMAKPIKSADEELDDALEEALNKDD